MIVASVTGGALEELSPTGQSVRTIQQVGPQAFGAASDATDRTGALNLFESASVGDLLGTGTPDVVKYELSLSAGREPAARRPELPLQPPHRRVRRRHRRCRCRRSRRSPTTTSSCRPTTSPRSARRCPTTRSSRARARPAARLRRADRTRRRGLPQGDRRLAVRARRARRRRAHGRHHARGLAVPVADRRRPPCQPQWPSFRHDQQGSGNYDRDGTPPDASRTRR